MFGKQISLMVCLPSCCPGFESQAHHVSFYLYSQICAIFVMFGRLKISFRTMICGCYAVVRVVTNLINNFRS